MPDWSDTVSVPAVLARMGIRLLTSLGGIAAGMVISDAVLSDFSATASAIVIATVVFWLVHIVVTFLALRVLVREPSIAMAGLLALASTVVSLIIVNLVVDDLKIHGVGYLGATLIIWITTIIGDMIGRNMLRARRRGDNN
jgi:hypothetical protein